MKLPVQRPVLTQEMVMRILEACLRRATELNIAVSMAILDDGGNQKGFLRMDKAPLMSSTISLNKAYTAVGFGLPTSEWYPRIKDDPELLHGLVHVDRMIVFGGGLPIHWESQLIGGIGVSGGTGEQDIDCAQTALGALSLMVNQTE